MINQEQYTIHELAKLAGVSTRTLHFYDEKGLLCAEGRRDNGYRVYTHSSLLRLQQILFLRELRFSLDQVAAILDQPNFDLARTLEVHEQTLQKEIERLNTLVHTVRKTIQNIKGETLMAPEEYFKGISEEKQKEYQEYIEKKYDPALVKESNRRYSQLSQAEKQALKEDGDRITGKIVASIPFGAASDQAQRATQEWYEHINHFYTCSLEIFYGLGQLYLEHPDFTANYRAIHPAMPEFLTEAMTTYCRNHGYSKE